MKSPAGLALVSTTHEHHSPAETTPVLHDPIQEDLLCLSPEHMDATTKLKRANYFLK
jgi:hypothetical protein